MSQPRPQTKTLSLALGPVLPMEWTRLHHSLEKKFLDLNRPFYEANQVPRFVFSRAIFLLRLALA